MIFEDLGSDFSAVLGKLGADLGSLVLFWFQGSLFGSFSAKLGSKMKQNGPSWDQVGRKLRPRVAKMLQDGQLGHFVASFGTISNQFWNLLVSFFAGGWE